MATGITEVSVISCDNTRYLQKIQAGPHIITADEPKSLGGDGTGATPISLMLAALGSCTSMTLKMYAERKGYAIEKIETYLSHETRRPRSNRPRDRDPRQGFKRRTTHPHDANRRYVPGA